MIISNSNTAKAKQKMSSYSHRGLKAGRASVSSYLLDNAVIKVGDHFAKNRPLYLSEDYKTNLLMYFAPEAGQLAPGAESTILASFSLDNPGAIASLDVVLQWEAEYGDNPDDLEHYERYYNYAPALLMIFRNSEGTELTRRTLDAQKSIGVFTYNAALTANYVHYIFDAVVSKVRLGGYTEDALNLEPNDLEFAAIPIVQRLKDGMDVTGKTLKFSNEFFEMFTEEDFLWTFVYNCCASSGVSPIAGANIPLVSFNSTFGTGFSLSLYILDPDTYEFAIMLYTPNEDIMIAKYATKSNGEGAWIIDNVCYSFPVFDPDHPEEPYTITSRPINYYFWNIRNDLITISNYDDEIDTNIFYTSIITGTGPAKYDTEQTFDRFLNPNNSLLAYNIRNNSTVQGLFRHSVLLVDTTHLDPQYGFSANVYCVPLVYYNISSNNTTLIFDIHSHDDTSSLKVTVGISPEDGLWIQDITANGNSVPLSNLGQLRWCIGLIRSGQGFKRAVFT